MSNKLKIIINADDFGRSKKINSGIIELVKLNLITSTTIMANGPYMIEAIKFAKKNPKISYGVHLNCTEFNPFNKKLMIKYLDSMGNFRAEIRDKVLFSDPIKFAREWISQVNYITTQGIKISHLDSHHHIHTIPKLLLSIYITKKNTKIDKIRISRNIIPIEKSGFLRRFYKKYTKYIWNFFIGKIFKFKVVDYFGSVTDFINCYNYFPESFWHGKTIELMCHPGNEYYEFNNEINILKQGLNRYIDIDYELISYNDLRNY